MTKPPQFGNKQVITDSTLGQDLKNMNRLAVFCKI